MSRYKELFKAAWLIGGRSVMVNQVCIPTLERGNEVKDGVAVVSGQVKEVSVQYQVGCHSCDSVDAVESRVCPQGYKQTEVGIIPDGWDVVELSEAVDFLDGLRKPVKAGDREKMRGHYRYYGASGVVDYVNDYLFDGSYILLGEDGENILSRNLPLAFRVNGKFWVNNHAHVMQPKNGFDIDYLTAFLESLDYSLLNSGTAQPKLNKQSCLSVKVAKPTKSEQTAIANALSDVDALITSLEKLIAKKRAIKTAAMQQLLTGKKRLPPFDLAHTGYKPTELGEIPEDWELVQLGMVLDKIMGGGTPSRANSSYWSGNIPWVTVKDFATFNPITSQEYITKLGLENSSSNLIPEGVLITSTRMALGKAVIYNVPVTINQDLKALFPRKIVDTKFLYYWFEDNVVQIDDLGSGSTVKGLSLLDLKALKFRLPSKHEQIAIANELSDMDKEIDTLEQRLKKTQQLKQGMMQELLTGRTRLI